MVEERIAGMCRICLLTTQQQSLLIPITSDLRSKYEELTQTVVSAKKLPRENRITGFSFVDDNVCSLSHQNMRGVQRQNHRLIFLQVRTGAK